MTDIQILNKWLVEQFGSDLRNRPWFRIVWADSEIEKRVGTFQDFYGPIWSGQFHGLREVKKYGNPIYRERWILEKLVYGIDNPQIWGDTVKDGSYEPIWVFRGPGDTYQRPTRKTCDFIIRSLNRERPKLTQRDVDYEEEESLKTEIDAEYEAMGAGQGALASQLHDGSAIAVSGGTK